MFWMIFSHFISATIFIFGKYILDVASPFFITNIRMLVGGLISVVIYTTTSAKKIKLSDLRALDFLFIFLLGVFYFYCKALFTFWGMQYLPPGRAAFIFNLGPFITAFLSYLIYNERMTVKKMFGMLIGFIGVGLLLADVKPVHSEVILGIFSWPELSVLGGVFSNAFGLMIIRYLVRIRKIPVLFFNSFGMVVCFFLSYGTTLYDPSLLEFQSGFEFKFITLILLISLLSIATVNLKAWVLKKYSATLLTFTSFIMPLLTTIMGCFLFDEKITSTFIVAFVIVVAGLYIFYSEELRQGYVVKSQ